MHKIATFRSDRAGRYMSALCHHFGRKVDTGCDDTGGWVQFSFGRCEMSVQGDELTFTVSADDQSQLDQVVEIVASHFDRFAFRENPELRWRPAGADHAPVAH